MPDGRKSYRAVPPIFFIIMKKILLSFHAVISAVQFLLLCVALSFTSCSNGDDESDGPQSGQVTSKSTWYLADDNLSSYVSEMKSSYNKDPLNYYSYVAEDGTLKRAGNNYGIEIINKNTLKIWYFSYGVVGCAPSLDSEFYTQTNYTIGPDKIISYSTYSSMYTYVENEGKMIVTNGDIYTVTPQGLVRDGSSTTMKKKTVNISDFKEEKQTIRDCKNKSNTTLTSDCNYDEFTCHVIFNSSLTDLHPNQPFVFGLEYGLKNGTLKTEESKEVNYETDVLIDGFLDYRMYYGSLLVLEEKLNNGETLTTSEASLYKSASKIINDHRTRAKQNYIVKGYVRYGGVKYYID